MTPAAVQREQTGIRGSVLFRIRKRDLWTAYFSSRFHVVAFVLQTRFRISCFLLVKRGVTFSTRRLPAKLAGDAEFGCERQ